MNRKLIRPNLANVKNQERDLQNNRIGGRGETEEMRRASNVNNQANVQKSSADAINSPASGAGKNRRPPQTETSAEIFYYKKQIDSHTLMIIVLQDNEEIEGTIEWYDRNALKINRKTAPNILLLKHNIKYMFKAEDRKSLD